MGKLVTQLGWYVNHCTITGPLVLPPSIAKTAGGKPLVIFPVQTGLSSLIGPSRRKRIVIGVAVAGTLARWALKTLTSRHVVDVRGQMWPAQLGGSPIEQIMLAAWKIDVLHVIDGRMPGSD